MSSGFPEPLGLSTQTTGRGGEEAVGVLGAQPWTQQGARAMAVGWSRLSHLLRAPGLSSPGPSQHSPGRATATQPRVPFTSGSV